LCPGRQEEHEHRYDAICRKVDVRLPGKGNSNSHGARPDHLIITMIKWIRTSRLSVKNERGITLKGPCVALTEIGVLKRGGDRESERER